MLAAIITVSIVLSLERFIDVAKAVTPFVIVYSVLASLAQFIVFGKIDASPIYINTARFAAVATISLSLVGCIDVSKLLELVYRLSPSLGVSLAMSIKMLRSMPRLWTTVYRLYRVNMSCNSYLDRVEIFLISVKAFLFLVFYSSIQSVEAVLTRSKIFRLATKRL